MRFAITFTKCRSIRCPSKVTRLELLDLLAANEGYADREIGPVTDWYQMLSSAAATNMATMGADVVPRLSFRSLARRRI